MKYAIVIPDGCADEPQASLGGRTPLQAASIPNMDWVARHGAVGRSSNTPPELTPGSDVAIMSLFGYDPRRWYTGRAPLEAAALGVELGPDDWAFRCNLITVADGRMLDFSGGHVATEDARQYMQSLAEQLGGGPLEFYAGVSYRNLMVYRGSQQSPAPFSDQTRTQPPHDIPDQPIADHMPAGPGSELLAALIERSRSLLADHTTNRERQRRGEPPVTHIWLWGQGQAPRLQPFSERYGKRGAIVTAVDLLRGLGSLIGWTAIRVPTATGYLDTDYAGKGRAAVAALQDYDLVCVHVEAPDEASHEGRADAKVQALEQIDRHVVGPLLEALQRLPAWRILVSPDHPTPLRSRVHERGLVPWAAAGTDIAASGASYHEAAAANSRLAFDPGDQLMGWFLGTGRAQ